MASLLLAQQRGVRNATLARSVESVKSIKDNPGASLDNFFESFFFGAADPYGRNADEASIDRIRRDDILAYTKGYLPEATWS